jgi:hypothetical protein
MVYASETAQLEYDLGVLRDVAEQANDEGDEPHSKALAIVIHGKQRRLTHLESDQASRVLTR